MTQWHQFIGYFYSVDDLREHLVYDLPHRAVVDAFQKSNRDTGGSCFDFGIGLTLYRRTIHSATPQVSYLRRSSLPNRAVHL